jgi:hypothetical protein
MVRCGKTVGYPNEAQQENEMNTSMTSVETRQTTQAKLNIFEYSDYRKYLADYYKLRKQQSAKFSYRFFAMKAGFSSASYLKLVIDGKRNLTECSQEKFSNAIGLNEKESEYFTALIGLSQSLTEREKMKFFKQCELLKQMNSWDVDKSNDINLSPEVKQWLEQGRKIAQALATNNEVAFLSQKDLLKGIIEQGFKNVH